MLVDKMILDIRHSIEVYLDNMIVKSKHNKGHVTHLD